MKNVLITGGNRGIGLSITNQLLEENYRILCIHKDKDKKLNVAGIEYYEYICDVRNRTKLLNAILDFTLKYGNFWGVINNAGIAHAKPFEKITTEEWDEIMDTNVKGVFNVCQFASPLLEDKGRIINISSVSGLQGMSGHAHYCASKFALQGLSQVLAKELKGRRITVNTVNPGPTNTDMWKQLDKEYSEINNWPEDMKQEDKYYDKLLIKRMGEPIDVANVVSFLLKPESEYITGTHIKVCGGNLLG